MRSLTGEKIPSPKDRPGINEIRIPTQNHCIPPILYFYFIFFAFENDLSMMFASIHREYVFCQLLHRPARECPDAKGGHVMHLLRVPAKCEKMRPSENLVGSIFILDILEW